MPSDPLVLAFDTSAAHCAAALLCGDAILATQVDPMSRGQAEHLMPMLEALLRDSDRRWTDLARIGVGIGPGNFTGIRISVSAARGLSLGLAVPAIGVSTLDAIQFDEPDRTAAVAAPRDTAYVQPPHGTPIHAAAEEYPHSLYATDPERLIIAMARLAARADAERAARPKPLYIKPADAAPARDSAPQLLS